MQTNCMDKLDIFFKFCATVMCNLWLLKLLLVFVMSLNSFCCKTTVKFMFNKFSRVSIFVN